MQDLAKHLALDKNVEFKLNERLVCIQCGMNILVSASWNAWPRD